LVWDRKTGQSDTQSKKVMPPVLKKHNYTSEAYHTLITVQFICLITIKTRLTLQKAGPPPVRLWHCPHNGLDCEQQVPIPILCLQQLTTRPVWRWFVLGWQQLWSYIKLNKRPYQHLGEDMTVATESAMTTST